MQQTVYRIVDGEIETIRILREITSASLDVAVVYYIEHEDGTRAWCRKDMYPKTQSDAWQEWANDYIENILILKARVRTDEETINRLNRELVGIE